jgi:hypothetical protein
MTIENNEENFEIENPADNSADDEIEIVDDTPEKDKGRKPLDREVNDPTDDELTNYSEGVQKRIKELTHARHDERRAKEALLREKQELERVARTLIEEHKKLRAQYEAGAQQFVETEASAADMAMDQAKRRYKDAYESGDADAIVAAQEALTEAKLRANSAKNLRVAPVQDVETLVQLPSSEPERPQIDDKTLRWQARNQWFGAPGHEDMTSFSLGLHQKLVNSGIDPRSDEYFEKIDSRMKEVFSDYFGGADDKPKTGDGSKKPATVVAPGARSTGAKKIQLTATQVALAKRFGLTPQQYAAELAKLEKSNG